MATLRLEHLRIVKKCNCSRELFVMLEDLKSVAVPLSAAAALTALGVLIAVAAGMAF
jgi:hypothetical protein